MKKMSYIIAGPTASGKSDFAHALARRIGGVIINCDSVQIYRGIENISASPLAKTSSTPALAAGVGARGCRPGGGFNSDGNLMNPPPAARESTGDPRRKGGGNFQVIDNIPYRLFSVLPLTEQISVAAYLELARGEYNAAIRSGRPAVFVGGTGFYIHALLNGISPIPEITDLNRKRARDMVRDYPDAARTLLKNADPDGGWEKMDPQRTARALEVFLETERPLSEWQSIPRRGAVVPDAYKILVSPPRDVLSARIAKRIPEMMAGGALAEARAVIAAGWPPERAIGASELVKFINGEISEQECYENWITRTNQYAKRQRTWFRTQFAADTEINRVPTDKDLDVILQGPRCT